MTKYQIPNTKYSLSIGWLYPELMSTYGDRGNIICLQKRCEWRGIKTDVLAIDQDTPLSRLKTIDLLFGGGAQDKEQDLVMKDLKGKKAEAIKELIDHNVPALFVCGAPQLMGKYYEPAVGKRIEGVGVFDMITTNPGPDVPRCIGNIVARIVFDQFDPEPRTIVGFENHGGRTFLAKDAKPFGKVIKGFGNNGNDGTEGVVYKNAIGCYFHGPLLPKNPHVADWLIKKALEVKYIKTIELTKLDDSMEWQAHKTIAKRLGVRI